MKCCKCLFYVAMGAGLTLLIQRYGKEMVTLCDKMMKKKYELVKDGLDLE